MKKGFIALLIIAAILVAGVIFCLNVFSPDALPMFENIDECELLAQKGMKLEKLDPVQADTYLDGLVYDDYFAATCSSATGNFTLYAYEFSTSERAAKYFFNATGKQSERETNFSIEATASIYRVVVYSGARVYFATTTPSDAEYMFEMLSEVFVHTIPIS